MYIYSVTITVLQSVTVEIDTNIMVWNVSHPWVQDSGVTHWLQGAQFYAILGFHIEVLNVIFLTQTHLVSTSCT
jgi:hypothetical protein